MLLPFGRKGALAPQQRFEGGAGPVDQLTSIFLSLGKDGDKQTQRSFGPTRDEGGVT